MRVYWEQRLAQGAGVVVPERRVMDAMRNLLIQNLVLTWRYSVGNPYQELATADGIAAAGVIGAYGFADVNREVLRTSFRKHPTPFPNWKMGAKLAGTGLYYRLVPRPLVRRGGHAGALRLSREAAATDPRRHRRPAAA